jgi:hypothetical protein
MTTQTRNISKGVLAGIAGGLLAAFVMDRFQALASKAGAGGTQDKGEQATVKAASAISEHALKRPLSDEEKKAAGPVMHYLMGGLSGGLYGAVASIAPGAKAGAGTLFGAALWLLADEFAVPALGLSKKPTEVEPGKQAMALASHLVYGLATYAARRALMTAV